MTSTKKDFWLNLRLVKLPMAFIRSPLLNIPRTPPLSSWFLPMLLVLSPRLVLATKFRAESVPTIDTLLLLVFPATPEPSFVKVNLPSDTLLNPSPPDVPPPTETDRFQLLLLSRNKFLSTSLNNRDNPSKFKKESSKSRSPSTSKRSSK